MKSRLRILIVGPIHPATGGISTYVSDLLNSPLNKKFDLICFPKNHPAYPHDNLNSNKITSAFYFIQLSLSVIFQLSKFIITLIRCKLDIIHIHTSSRLGFLENSLYVLISKLFRKKVIIHIHGGLFDYFFLNSSSIKKVYIKYILSLSNKIICLSSYWSNFFVNKIGINEYLIHTIPNGYDTSLFYPIGTKKCRISLNLPLDKKIIITVGNLIGIKGHIYLIEAMEYIITKRKDIVCLIIGDGPLKKELTQQIHSKGLINYVQLIGKQPHNQIPLWMNACDLFVFPSIRESFGLVQIEAMACGKPVIATYNTGSEEIITSKELGTLCQNSNSKKMADAILASLDKNYSASKITTYCLKYSWLNIYKNISDIYEII